MSKMNEIPRYESEDAEREFWSGQDSSELIDWKKAQAVRFPNLKPSTKTISVRFPESLLEDLKIIANKRDVPYQSLLKIFVAERVDEEMRGDPSR
jgi:predicted DNA binding CopG/RHH family protein